jgi:hypothetical protein
MLIVLAGSMPTYWAVRAALTLLAHCSLQQEANGADQQSRVEQPTRERNRSLRFMGRNDRR